MTSANRLKQRSCSFCGQPAMMTGRLVPTEGKSKLRAKAYSYSICKPCTIPPAFTELATLIERKLLELEGSK